MKTILFVPKGAISEKDKETLLLENYVVIEIDDPTKIKTISDLSFVGSDVVVTTAVETLSGQNATASIKQDFGERIIRKALEKIKSKSPTP